MPEERGKDKQKARAWLTYVSFRFGRKRIWEERQWKKCFCSCFCFVFSVSGIECAQQTSCQKNNSWTTLEPLSATWISSRFHVLCFLAAPHLNICLPEHFPRGQAAILNGNVMSSNKKFNYISILKYIKKNHILSLFLSN